MPKMIGTPAGTRDRLFAECASFRRVQQALTGFWARMGYSELMTPEVEDYDTMLRSGSPLPQEAMYKLVDRTGRLLVLRPDNTAPVARVAATKLQTLPGPQRLFYNQTVFRCDELHSGASNAIAQCGVELIGAAGLRADVEMVALAVRTLETAGLGEFRIELGHEGFFSALLAQLPAEEALRQQLRGYVEAKNFAAYADLLAPWRGTPEGEALAGLSRLFGGPEVLSQARTLCGLPEAAAALDHLAALYGALASAGLGARVQFDLSMVQPLDYYTGVVFRGFARGAAAQVLSGGRYDALVGRYGKPRPACGFAVDVEGLADCLPEAEPPRLHRLVWYAEGCLGAALAAVARGGAVLAASDTAAAAADEARALGLTELLCVDETGEREVTL